MLILYFIDETEKYELQRENENKKTCVGIIMVDNYEEVMQRVDTEQKTQLMAKVESIIYDWVNETNGILVKEDRDTYVYIFEQRNLGKIKEDKFAILDSIKDIVRKEKLSNNKINELKEEMSIIEARIEEIDSSLENDDFVNYKVIEELTDEKDELEYRYLEIVDILERDKKL